MGEIKKKMGEPALTPVQIGIYVLVQIVSVIQGVLPLLIGTKFNVEWFIISFIMNNVAYILILWMRGAIDPEGAENSKSQILQFMGNKIIDILGIIKSTPKDELKPALERLLIWTVRELDVFYQEEMLRFTNYIDKTYLKSEVIPFRFKEDQESSKTELEALRDNLKQLNGDITEQHPEIKAQIIALEAKLAELE